ncbi:hypothetical protein vseg_011858 [Gypsophila vaccaria]
MSEFPKPPPSQPPSSAATPANLHHPPRRSRPRVREVSSRFMSPSTPSESKFNSLRRSQTDLRHRFGDENRPDLINRRSLSPVRSGKPRSAVKLFREPNRSDTPQRQGWDTAAAKLLRINGISAERIRSRDAVNSNGGGRGGDDDDDDDVNSDCDSVKSEPCEVNRNNPSNARVSTPFSRSMETPFRRGEGGGTGAGVRGTGKVARGLNLPPVPPSTCLRAGEGVKKAVRKGTSGGGQVEEVHRLRMLYNRYMQWRFANARAEACMVAQRKQCEKQLYSLGEKIAELRESVKSKRIEYGILKESRTLSTILDVQMPYLDEWSALDESYSSSLLELSNGLMNVLSQLPLDGNVRADVKEIEEALHSALKATEMIYLQVQSFMPKAEDVDNLISDLARVCSGEITLVDECGDLLSKTHLSQVEECSLRGQVMQLHNLKLDQPKDNQR